MGAVDWPAGRKRESSFVGVIFRYLGTGYCLFRNEATNSEIDARSGLRNMIFPPKK